MARYIDAEEAENVLINRMAGTGYQSRAVDSIAFVPTADVAEVRHGAWIIEDAGGGWKRAICPHCREIFLYAKGHYQIGIAPRCPECGAKIGGEKE